MQTKPDRPKARRRTIAGGIRQPVSKHIPYKGDQEQEEPKERKPIVYGPEYDPSDPFCF